MFGILDMVDNVITKAGDWTSDAAEAVACGDLGGMISAGVDVLTISSVTGISLAVLEEMMED